MEVSNALRGAKEMHFPEKSNKVYTNLARGSVLGYLNERRVLVTTLALGLIALANLPTASAGPVSTPICALACLGAGPLYAACFLAACGPTIFSPF